MLSYETINMLYNVYFLFVESSSVEVSVVLLYTPDQSISTDRDKPADKTYIQLADPVKVLIAPKPPK